MLLLAGPASAQDFLPLSDVASKSPTGRVLFFPLAERFEAASPYALLPASGRRITWTPESAELPAASVAATSVRAIGTPPARAEEARYLVPVLDGAGAALTFAPLRLDGSRLVPFEGEPKPGLDVVPVLSGPRLDATPSETPLERVLDAPVELDADVLEDVVPSVLVRKATPSRVVFGVQVGAAYVPLVDEAGLAVAAKHEDRAGLAVAVADDFVPPSTTAPPRSPSPEDDSGGGVPWAVVGAVSGGVVLAVGLVLARRRRRR
jgi:hypothetical protein